MHLITGGSGFLGWRLARALVAKGETVRVFDLARSEALPAQVEFIKGDVQDAAALTQAAIGAEVIHHLVGIMPQARAPEPVMQAVNVEGTRNALAAARSAGVRRFVFLSSMEVYGYPVRAPFTEDHTLAPIGAYGRNKVEAEALCVQSHRDYGLETVSLRPSTLVGPGINEATFNSLLDLLNHPPPIFPVPGGGKSRFQMTHVDDCVSAGLLAAARPGVAGLAFNIGADNTLTMRDQVAEIFSRLGRPAPRFLPIPSGLARGLLLLAYRLGFSKLEPDHIKLMDTDMVMDCELAKRTLGWRPAHTNVDMTIETYRARQAAAGPHP
jgi:nucleoside-diphosphate-sugar epimerase